MVLVVISLSVYNRLQTPENVDQEQKIIKIGTLLPIGSLFDIPTFFDQRLVDGGSIAFGTGLRTKTIVMGAENFVRIFEPEVGNFSK